MQDDVTPKNGRGRKIACIAGAAFTAAGILFCGYQLVTVYQGYAQAEDEYAYLRDSYLSREIPEAQAVPEGTPERVPKDDLFFGRPWGDFPAVSVDVDSLYAENSDFYAWMLFPDGLVDYPVMQEPEGEENVDFYLKRGFHKESLSAGCLFASNELPFETEYSNFYIYGHNMKNGSMFGSLDDVYAQGELTGLTDPYFYLYNRKHEQVKYRILSIYNVSDDDKEHYNAPGDPLSYDNYIQSILEAGSVLEKFPLTEWEQECVDMRSQLCTMYACFGKHGSGQRLFVHGVEIGREDFSGQPAEGEPVLEEDPAAEEGGEGI